MKRAYIYIIIFSLLLSFSINISHAKEEGTPKALAVGDIITDFTLSDGIVSGKTISFDKDIKGKSKVIVIIFMTTACSACKGEMEVLNKVANTNPENLRLYAVSVDLEGDKTVPIYNDKYHYKTRYMLDPDFTIPQNFGFIYTPGLLVANSEGKILFMQGGFTIEDSNAITNELSNALNLK